MKNDREVTQEKAFEIRQEVYGLTTHKLREEVILNRVIDWGYLLSLLAKGIIWLILNWKTVKAEIDRIRGVLTQTTK